LGLGGNGISDPPRSVKFGSERGECNPASCAARAPWRAVLGTCARWVAAVQGQGLPVRKGWENRADCRGAMRSRLPSPRCANILPTRRCGSATRSSYLTRRQSPFGAIGSRRREPCGEPEDYAPRMTDTAARRRGRGEATIYSCGLTAGISARRTRSLASSGRSRARSASGPRAGFAPTTTPGSRRGRRRCRSRR
jgi:hypothetical protein